MKYVHVEWLTKRLDVATSMYYEIRSDGFESRKVEIYPDGKTDLASEDFESDKTWLSHEKFPSIEEINEDTQFKANLISKDEFETQWNKALSARSS